MRVNNVDAMRFSLASLVVLSHCWPITGGPVRERLGEPLMRASAGQLTMGALAVDAFFLISGCLVSQSWDRSRGALDFIRKRVRRIYPGFLAMSVITALVVAPLMTAHYRPYTLREVGLLIFDAFDLAEYGYPHGGGLLMFATNALPYAVNSSLWSVRYEFVCYVGLAGLGAAGLLRRRWVVLSVLALSWGLYVANLDPHTPRLALAIVGRLPVWPRVATFFLAGVAWHRLELRADVRVAAVALAVMAIALPHPVAARVVLPAALPCALFYLAGIPGRLNRFGAHGDFSYGIYIYSFTVQQILVATWPGLSVGALFAVAWPASVACGVASWYAVERRWLRRNSRLPA